MKILIITASPKNEEQSYTKQMVNKFIDCYKNNNEVIIETIDLYDVNINYIDQQMLTSIYNGKDNNAHKFACEFAAADRYVFAAPIWNLNMPAIMKAYIDFITYNGITYTYGQNGPIGNLENKKALFLQSSGGIFTTSTRVNHGNVYMQDILNFLGVSNYTNILLEGTNYFTQEELEHAINKVNYKIETVAKTF